MNIKRFFLIVCFFLLVGCSQTSTYSQVTSEEAKTKMEQDCIILDVREEYEYEEGHVPNAICIPYTEIEERTKKELPNKDQLILVYCRSGNRSKKGADILVELGYTNVVEFGGIIDWPYDIEK